MTASPTTDRATDILNEALNCFKGGRLRSAMHGAYDAVSFLCESRDPPRGRFSYSVAIGRRVTNQALHAALSFVGACRERTAHYPYDTPSKHEVQRALAAVITFFDFEQLKGPPSWHTFVDDYVHVGRSSKMLMLLTGTTLPLRAYQSSRLGIKCLIPDGKIAKDGNGVVVHIDAVTVKLQRMATKINEGKAGVGPDGLLREYWAGALMKPFNITVAGKRCKAVYGNNRAPGLPYRVAFLLATPPLHQRQQIILEVSGPLWMWWLLTRPIANSVLDTIRLYKKRPRR